MKRALIAFLFTATAVFSLTLPMQAPDAKNKIVCIQDGYTDLAVDIETGVFVCQAASDGSSGIDPFSMTGRASIARNDKIITLTYPIGPLSSFQTVNATFDAPESNGREGEFVVTSQYQTYSGHTDNYAKSVCPVVPAGLSEKK